MADQRTHKRKQTKHVPDPWDRKEKIAIGCLYLLLAIATITLYFPLRGQL